MHLQRFVNLVFVLLGLVILVHPERVVRAMPSQFGHAPTVATLTHGPVVGGVSDTTAVVFARANTTSTVQIQYSTDPTFVSNVVTTPGVQAIVENDYTVQIPLSGLQAATRYYYRVLLNMVIQSLSVPAYLTTAPPPETVSNFNFVVFSDAFYTATEQAKIYQTAATDLPVFALQIGDFDHRDPGLQTPVLVDNWRLMHRQQLAGFAAGLEFRWTLGATTPFYHIWDDHDYGSNNADRTAAWKPMATKAFKEYFPLPSLPNPTSGLWYSFRYAQAEVFVLDLRSQRDPNSDPDTANKSMLDGANIANGQKAWLKASLLASTARWKFIVSSSAWNPTGKQDDSWYRYRIEQQELVQFINTNNIGGVIILSGDIHTAGGAIDDGTHSYFPEFSIPTQTAKRDPDCTGGAFGCGLWSHGVVTGLVPASYGLITVEHDLQTEADRVIFRGKSHEGVIWLQHTLEVFPPAPTTTPTPEATFTETSVPTVTDTGVPTATPLPTATETTNPTPTMTLAPTTTPTPEATFTETSAPTATDTGVPTATPLPTATETANPTSTATLALTDTPTFTAIHTTTPTTTPTSTSTRTPTLTVTRTPTSTSTLPDMIFSDGVEGGSFSTWSASVTDGGDLSVTTSAALVGLRGIQAMLDDNNSIYLTDDRPATEPRYRVRFYFDPNSLVMATNNAHYVFQGYQGTSTVVLRLELAYSSGYRIRARAVTDANTWISTSWFSLTDAPHFIELDWRAALAPGANNGGVTLWLDGVQKADLTTLDNDTRRIDRARLGAVSGVDSGTRGTYYFDAFESRRVTYIGP